MTVTPPPRWSDLWGRIWPSVVFLLAVLGFLLGFTAHGIGAEPGRWMTVMASAYCPCPVCCGERAAGITANGTRVVVEPYGIAAHPGYLPYGTRVVVPAGLGYLDRTRAADRVFIVDDTGGLIRRRTEESPDLWLDLRFRSHASAVGWGVRAIRVYVLDCPDRDK